MVRAESFRRVGDVLGQAVGGDSPLAETLTVVFGRWESLVGAEVARHAQPLRLEGTTVLVAVDHGAWATQLQVLVPQLERRLREATREAVQNVRVVTRRL